MSPQTNEKELEILEAIYEKKKPLPQRDLAEIAGLSLGMTNAILKRLVTKGLLTIKKINNRNIRYAVSTEGVEEISRRSYRYLKRTIKHVVSHKKAVDDFVRKLKTDGYRGIFFLGNSDLEFIIEHCVNRHELELIREKPEGNSGNGTWFTLYSEKYIPDKEQAETNAAFLQDVLLQKNPGQ